MTTITTSVDEYRVNLLTVVQMFADGVLPTGMRGVATAIDEYAAAVRAEVRASLPSSYEQVEKEFARLETRATDAEAERDEAIVFLQRVKEAGFRSQVWKDATEFLARFPESKEQDG